MNYTIDTSLINNQYNFTHLCELNQAKLIENTSKLSLNAYIVLLVGLAFLLFYFFIQPKLKQNLKDSLLYYPGITGTALVFLSAWVLFFSVFQLKEEQLIVLMRVANWLIVPLLIVATWFVFRWVKKEK